MAFNLSSLLVASLGGCPFEQKRPLFGPSPFGLEDLKPFPHKGLPDSISAIVSGPKNPLIEIMKNPLGFQPYWMGAQNFSDPPVPRSVVPSWGTFGVFGKGFSGGTPKNPQTPPKWPLRLSSSSDEQLGLSPPNFPRRLTSQRLGLLFLSENGVL